MQLTWQFDGIYKSAGVLSYLTGPLIPAPSFWVQLMLYSSKMEVSYAKGKKQLPQPFWKAYICSPDLKETSMEKSAFISLYQGKLHTHTNNSITWCYSVKYFLCCCGSLLKLVMLAFWMGWPSINTRGLGNKSMRDYLAPEFCLTPSSPPPPPKKKQNQTNCGWIIYF